MNIEIEKEIVNALPSLYPLQDYEEEAIDTIIKAIPHWIPVTERLPEKDGAYLVTADGFPVSTKFYSADSYGWGEEWRRVITAWMPLPDPWKGK